MTTDNKTLAVDVLAVWAEMADSISKRRDECLGRGQFIQAEIYREMLAKHSRSMIAVAELIEAASEIRTSLSLTRSNVMTEFKRGATQWDGVPELMQQRIDVFDAALARVKGESA